jgi:hypothetical protein
MPVRAKQGKTPTPTSGPECICVKSYRLALMSGECLYDFRIRVTQRRFCGSELSMAAVALAEAESSLRSAICARAAQKRGSSGDDFGTSVDSRRLHVCMSKAIRISLSACSASSLLDMKVCSHDSQTAVTGCEFLTIFNLRSAMPGPVRFNERE